MIIKRQSKSKIERFHKLDSNKKTTLLHIDHCSRVADFLYILNKHMKNQDSNPLRGLGGVAAVARTASRADSAYLHHVGKLNKNQLKTQGTGFELERKNNTIGQSDVACGD